MNIGKTLGSFAPDINQGDETGLELDIIPFGEVDEFAFADAEIVLDSSPISVDLTALEPVSPVDIGFINVATSISGAVGNNGAQFSKIEVSVEGNAAVELDVNVGEIDFSSFDYFLA